MASQPELLQSCLQEAARAAKPAQAHCIETAVAALQVAEMQSMKVAKRDEQAGAWRGLLDQQSTWGTRYQADLLAAFNQGVAAASATGAEPGARRMGGLGLDAFSLVDDADVTQAIESSRLLQHILPRVEQTLAELDTLISSAQGLANVRPESNPLRPEVFTQVLQGLMAGAAADPSLVSIWVKHLADPMGRELKSIYEKVIHRLELANVQAANYRVLQTPASVTAKARGGASTGGAAGSGGHDTEGADPGKDTARPPSQYADLSNYEIRDELFQDFLFHGGSNARHGLAPSYYATVEEELSALKAAPDSAVAPLSGPAAGDETGYRAVPAVDRPQRFVDVSSPLSAKVWGTYGRSRERAMVRTQLKKEATRVGQVLGLEVVRQLVNQVAQDSRLLAPVREAIVALEPSLLRLAMVDPRFFSDEGHPGRRLMERVAQRSFKYNDEYSPEFAVFFQAVARSFNELNALVIEDAKPFGMALAALKQAWDQQDQLEFESRHKVLRALHFAEERQQRADQIAVDLSARSDLDNVPGVVLDFLLGPWSLVMAHAKIMDQRKQVDPEGFGSVVPDLLWSVKRNVTLKRPAKLIEMIPGLLDKLHSGLDMLGQTTQENGKFFESLMKLHQPVLKLRRLKSKRDADESGAVPLGETEEPMATPEQRRARAAGQPWLGRDELDAAGFEDTQPTAPGELVALDELPEIPSAIPRTISAAVPPTAGPLSAAVQAAAAKMPDTPETAQVAEAEANASPRAHSAAQAGAILLGLRTGSWVDLYSKRRWLRAQLTWASSKATLFMFVSHGGQPHSMTRRSCEKLIMQRWLRPVDTQAVVAQALDAVACEAAAQAPPVRQDANAFLPSAAPQDEPETV